uniref:Ion transport domain-containing protein n=1 Tax=Phaeomonas parva TaxID=124430 RepID=A0A7S1TUF1_9STRA
MPQAAAAADGQLGGAEGWRSELAVAVAFLAGALAALLLLFFAAHELQGMVQSGPYEHLRGDIWNCVDFVSIIAQGLTLFLLVVDYRRAGGGVSVHGDFQASSTCASIALPPAWFSLLYFMLGFEGSGMLARMVIEITRGVRDFVIILAVVVIGFALSFYVLFQAGSMQHDPMTVGDVDVEDEVFGYRNPLAALVSGFALMLGDFDRDEFSASANESLMNVLFVVFQVFVTIIMLNLLIAIMGDIFDKVSPEP